MSVCDAMSGLITGFQFAFVRVCLRVCACVLIIYYSCSAHLNIRILEVNPLKSKSDPFLYPYTQERVT